MVCEIKLTKIAEPEEILFPKKGQKKIILGPNTLTKKFFETDGYAIQEACTEKGKKIYLIAIEEEDFN